MSWQFFTFIPFIADKHNFYKNSLNLTNLFMLKEILLILIISLLLDNTIIEYLK